jgi:hypothetical protein
MGIKEFDKKTDDFLRVAGLLALIILAILGFLSKH